MKPYRFFLFSKSDGPVPTVERPDTHASTRQVLARFGAIAHGRLCIHPHDAMNGRCLTQTGGLQSVRQASADDVRRNQRHKSVKPTQSSIAAMWIARLWYEHGGIAEGRQVPPRSHP
jgi:hypothetical protein